MDKVEAKGLTVLGASFDGLPLTPPPHEPLQVRVRPTRGRASHQALLINMTLE